MKSFGSGSQVKLPGSAPDQPNVYSFNTTYDEMYKDLLRKDRQLYPYNLAFSQSRLRFQNRCGIRLPLCYSKEEALCVLFRVETRRCLILFVFSIILSLHGKREVISLR